jgi:hypothetical protein
MMLKRWEFNTNGGGVYWQVFDRAGKVSIWGDIHCFVSVGTRGCKTVKFVLIDGHVLPVNPKLEFDLMPAVFNESEENLMFDRMLDSFVQIARSIRP